MPHKRNFKYLWLDLAVQNRQRGIVYEKRIGSYITFLQFRHAWAWHLGFDLYEMKGFSGSQPWNRQEPLPLQSFFNHSDSEGTISWREAEKILQQARKDAPKLPEFKQQFRVLIEACQHAVEHKTPLIFW